MKKTDQKERVRMTIEEAAEFMAERPAKERLAVSVYSPFPPISPSSEKDPTIKRWIGRIRIGTQEGTLAHYRGTNDRSQVFYTESDLLEWFAQKYTRQPVVDWSFPKARRFPRK